MRAIVFILILLYQSQNALSLTKTPFFIVTLPNFLSPGILIAENTGLLLWRYSMICVSVSRPVTSWKGILDWSPQLTWKLKEGRGQIAFWAEPSSAMVVVS